jgi:cell division protein FtsB
MLEKTKIAKFKVFSRTLSDVRNLGLLAFGIIALLVTWSGIKVVQTNYDLQKQISAMQQENEVNKLENSNLALSNQFYETDQYLELVARKQFNKGLEGEKLLIVPQSVALAHSKDIADPQVQGASTPAEESGPWYERNFNAWMQFLFRKDS